MWLLLEGYVLVLSLCVLLFFFNYFFLFGKKPENCRPSEFGVLAPKIMGKGSADILYGCGWYMDAH